MITSNALKDTTPTTASIESLQINFEGDLLLPGSAAYDASRTVWNSMIDRRPAVIAQCVTSADVIQAVMFARKQDLAVSVKGGGHNVAGNAVCQGGLMIDLSKMKKVRIDPEACTATAEPGVLWKEFDHATMQYNLATTGGTVSDTGIAGLTLGGGLGWLMGKWGSTCDNLLSAEIVTADGRLLKADKHQNTDLFWALRGGGGNFGIVTLFEYQLHPVEPNVMAGMLLYAMEDAKEVFRFYQEYVRKAPDGLMSYSGFIVTPDGVPVTMILPAWMGPLEEAEKQLAPLRKFGSPLADLISVMPYTQLQSILDTAAPAGIRRYWKSGYFTELSEELLDIYLKHIATRPSPLSPVLFFHIRGAIAKIDSSATAFPHRHDQWDSDIISQWTDASDDEKNMSWTRAFWKDIAPFARGVYVNHLDSDDGNDRVRTAFGANYEKLQQIKRIYDPENLFRLNNNILPAS